MRINIYTDNRKNVNGMRQIQLRITADDGGKFRIQTGIECINEPIGLVFPKEEPLCVSKSAALSEIYTKVYRFGLEHIGMECESLHDGILVMLGRKKDPKDCLLVDALKNLIETKSKDGTKQIYNGTIKAITEYAPDIKLRSITDEWLRKFAEHRNRAHNTNGTAIHLRNIRAAFNHAIKNGITDYYPFSRYKIQHEETLKRNLSLEQLRTLRDYPCEGFQEEARDMFMLMFYLRGISTIDLLNLRKSDVKDGNIVYSRKKTDKEGSSKKRKILVRLEPEANALIEKYAGKVHLINVLEKYKFADHRDYIRRVNKWLKDIGRTHSCGRKTTGTPLFPDISTYWCRHSWASLAAEADVPMETIAYSLGHSTGFAVTEIYINFSQKKIDSANRRVIDLLNADLRPQETPSEAQQQSFYSPWGYSSFDYIYTT